MVPFTVMASGLIPLRLVEGGGVGAASPWRLKSSKGKSEGVGKPDLYRSITNRVSWEEK